MSFLIVFALASFVAAPIPKVDPLQEAKQGFQGEWEAIEFVTKGISTEKAGLVGGKVVVKGDTITFAWPNRKEEGSFTLNPKIAPAAFDITLIERGEVVTEIVTLNGIYKLEKEKLTLCWVVGCEDRPRKFKSEEDSGTYLLVLERVKK